MKAIVYQKYGAASEVLELKELAKPTPKANEVLIRVHAATVNRTDCAIVKAKPFIMRFFTGLLKPCIPTPGTDFAGQIEAIGKDVTTFKVGDKVFGFEDQGLGSHTQYMTLAENKAFALMPENISYEQAAASLEGVHYAYNFLNKLTLAGGQKVLVNGATGAIGSAAVQLLKYYGVDVTAVCNTQNLELIKSIGADKVIDYLKEDFTQSTEKYDFVFDAVGKSTFGKCKPVLKPEGIYISSELGPGAENIYLSMITPLTGKQKVVFPVPSDCKRTVLLIKKIIEEGKFKAVIDRRYPMKEIVDAFTYVESGQKTGNVMITFED